jgi:predicted transcriptional regulator
VNVQAVVYGLGLEPEKLMKLVLDLNDLDIECYYLLLKNGPLDRKQLAKALDKSIPTIGRCTYTLHMRGLIEVRTERVGRGSKDIYTPLPPEHVCSIIEDLMKMWEEKVLKGIEDFESMMEEKLAEMPDNPYTDLPEPELVASD